MSEPGTKGTGDAQVDEFMRKLAALDVGAKARLKRNAGLGLAEARDVLGLFYRLLPYGVPTRDQERYFLVATLYPLAENGSQRDLGATLRAARSTANGTGLDRRVEVLLDSDGEQLRFRLRQAVRFAHSNRISVNWGRLLRDILFWDQSDRFVQRRWAESYFSEYPTRRREPGNVTSSAES